MVVAPLDGVAHAPEAALSRRFLVFSLLAVALCAALLVRPGAVAIGRHLVREDAIAKADAIVVLGGDVYKRAPHAATLYAAGVAPRILAVGGTLEQGPLAEARKTAKVLANNDVPASVVMILGRNEPGTVEEAAAIASAAAAGGWTEVAVVTSPYHTWRAGQLLEDALGDDVRVVMVPSPLDPFEPEGWWRDATQRRRVRNEYGKWMLWRLGF